MYSLKSVFAVISYVVATLVLVWGVVFTSLPWQPRSKLEAAVVVGSVFAVSLGLLVLSWKLVRRARADIALDTAHAWRISDYVLCGEAA